MKTFGRKDEYITFNVEHKLFATGSTEWYESSTEVPIFPFSDHGFHLS